MARHAQELLEELLELPANDRARLAASLLRSLDEELEDESEDEPAYEQAWSDEIARRLHEIDDGSVKLLSEEDAFRLIDSDDPAPER
jgi:putative addiction module component (TIGR02574 family)